MKKLLTCWMIIFSGFITQGYAQSGDAIFRMPKVELQAGMFRIEARVAANEKDRMQGLMHVRTMQPHQGMLFVFDRPGEYCMWMKNTLIPLTVAFMDETGKIINLADMEPQSEQNHCARRPALFALEMNRGWFTERRLQPGTFLRGLEMTPIPH